VFADLPDQAPLGTTAKALVTDVQECLVAATAHVLQNPLLYLVDDILKGFWVTFVQVAATPELAVRLEDPGQLLQRRQVGWEWISPGGRIQQILHSDKPVEARIYRMLSEVAVFEQEP
jgi:hypothetical protein